MKLTLEKLKELEACEEGIDWFASQKETNLKKVCRSLLKENKFEWANWLICRLLNLDNQKKYAINAASSVLHIFEEKYPDDKRPRKALKAAKKYFKNKSLENLESLKIAADAVAYAAAASYAAAVAANAAVYAADAAAYAAARSAANAARAYAIYTDAVDAATAAADDAATDSIRLKIINYGLKLISEQEK